MLGYIKPQLLLATLHYVGVVPDFTQMEDDTSRMVNKWNVIINNFSLLPYFPI